MLTDLNKLEAWILEQSDLWLPESLAFHKSHLYNRYLEVFSPNTVPNCLERDRIIKTIALAELGARHKRMDATKDKP
jgi:hypothetical protein